MVSPLLAVSCFVGPTACLERDKRELVSVGGANTLGWGVWSLTWLEYWLFVTSQRAQLCVEHTLFESRSRVRRTDWLSENMVEFASMWNLSNFERVPKICRI